jgi:SAM-dependent methyltransferase
MIRKALRRLAGRTIAASRPAAYDFDEAFYLATYPDIRRAVADGVFGSGWAHYERQGREEGRSPNPTVASSWPRAPMVERLITTMAELDAEIEHLRELQSRSFSEWLRARQNFRFQEDVAALPSDPMSDAYRDAQLALYHRLAGVTDYNPWIAEPIPISVADSVDPHPFPFSTQDGELIGSNFISMGHILRTLWRVHPGGGKRILEYGCGTGFTTLQLAASGYRMTAVDINAQALQVIDAMAEARKLDIATFNGEFGCVPEGAEPFDVILFYESFHHCLEFIPLLRKLHGQLRPGGVVLFAGEPIVRDFAKPWGLRLDGGSVWEIRTNGWLELGFREDFFLKLLEETGWRTERFSVQDASDIFVARSAV